MKAYNFFFIFPVKLVGIHCIATPTGFDPTQILLCADFKANLDLAIVQLSTVLEII